MPGELRPSHPWYRMLWEELLVAAFEDVHLGVVQARVVIGCTVPFPDEAAPGAAREGGTGQATGHKEAMPCTHGLKNLQAHRLLRPGMTPTRQARLVGEDTGVEAEVSQEWPLSPEGCVITSATVLCGMSQERGSKRGDRLTQSRSTQSLAW